MATDGANLHDGNQVAGGNYSNGQSLSGQNGSGQYLGVIQSAVADRTVLLSGANARSWGILQNNPALGNAADVVFVGFSKAVYGATVVRGAYLTTDANGRLVTATTGQFALAQAIESGAVGEVRSVRVLGATVIAP